MSKRTVEDSLRLDLARLSEQGLYELCGHDSLHVREPGISGSVAVRLNRKAGVPVSADAHVRGGGMQAYQEIAFTSTSPSFGGKRLWFACPNCGARCRVLYLPPRAIRLACRTCHRLTYRDRLRRREPTHELMSAIERLDEASLALAGARPDLQGAKLKRVLLRGIHAARVYAAYLEDASGVRLEDR